MLKSHSFWVVLAAGTVALATTGIAQAQERGPQPSLAVMAGSVSPDPSGTSSDWGYGIEFGHNCRLLQPTVGVLRHNLSVSRYSEDPLRMTSAELNSHWMFDATPNLQIGFGPGLGYVRAKLGDETNGVWAAQVGASLKYNMDNRMFLGLEARHQFTESDRFRNGREDVDNFRVMAKVGMNF
ncbi:MULTISPECIES: outer membrane beta-barrel protein [unclassified Thioalkalivibrio]|uniref:outer membrane beta-barrel protein n=1 Tax=unclassified Thioalkalivibrio TaxID=2621013 RepID=UPI000378B842|nr:MULTISPECIES: outer membrane beta-barrel protein [unclassified Thioalkalivibrio]